MGRTVTLAIWLLEVCHLPFDGRNLDSQPGHPGLNGNMILERGLRRLFLVAAPYAANCGFLCNCMGVVLGGN